MDLLALVDFNLVARHGGFGKAARAAGRPKATLSRRVAELEASLDLRLFERGTRDLKLTEEGRSLFERTAVLLTEIDETAVAIASGGGRPRGRLRISAPLLFSQTAMGRLSAGFALTYPEVRLEVTTEDRTVDMIEEAYDLVIRVNPDPDENLVGRAFLHDRLVVVASPDLDRPRGHVRVPAVIRGAVDRTAAWTMTTATGRTEIAIDPVLRLSSLIMVRDAVLAGVGAGRLPVSLVSHDLSAGALVGGRRRVGHHPVGALSVPPALERPCLCVPRLSQGCLPEGISRRAGCIYRWLERPMSLTLVLGKRLGSTQTRTRNGSIPKRNSGPRGDLADVTLVFVNVDAKGSSWRGKTMQRLGVDGRSQASPSRVTEAQNVGSRWRCFPERNVWKGHFRSVNQVPLRTGVA